MSRQITHFNTKTGLSSRGGIKSVGIIGFVYIDRTLNINIKELQKDKSIKDQVVYEAGFIV